MTRAQRLGDSSAPILRVEHLRTEFRTSDGVVHPVNDVSFEVHERETLAIVGESGSGKTVTMLSVMGLIPSPPGRIVSGRVLFEGVDLLSVRPDVRRRLRGSRMAMIFQEPLSSLNPVFTVGEQIAEVLRLHLGLSRRAAHQRAIELLAMVNVPQPQRAAGDYPHQLSGGMCQRVMLALALACHPRLLIADEPTTALDVTTQEQLLDLVQRLQQELGMAVVWITHDLGIVAGLADRVVVMYAGQIVEVAPVTELYADPLHPYTLGLLDCIPRLDRERPARLRSIPGAPPDLLRQTDGCPFAPRCPCRLVRCVEEMPPLVSAGAPDRARACWAPEPDVRRVHA